MKIQIDLTAKTIKLESNVNFGEFVIKMQEMLPDWKEYKISTNTVIEWKEFPVYRYERRKYYPWWNDVMYTDSTSQLTAIGTSTSGLEFTSNSNPLFEKKAPKTSDNNLKTISDILYRWENGKERESENIINVEI
jgi:hypothetical protein